MSNNKCGPPFVFILFMFLVASVTRGDLIDLSGATTGPLIVAPGGSFAQSFVGQTVNGSDVTGSPTGPLTLNPGGDLVVEPWDPNVSPPSNSLRSAPPANQGPLSVLLDSLANELRFTAGEGDGPNTTFRIDFFDQNGSLVNTIIQDIGSSFQIYSYRGFGSFLGFTISDNNDPQGLRFQNFEYNTGSSIGTAVPEPSAIVVWGIVFVVAIAWRLRRRMAAIQSTS